MSTTDPNDIFFSNSLDASEKLLGLEQFQEYVGYFLSNEARHLEEEAHPDLALGFLPLFADTLPPILHSSVLISTTTLLEQEMRGYAATLLEVISSELKFSELTGGVLERFRVVTSKIAGFKLDEIQTPWPDVVGLFEIRNCLVHSGGDLSNFQKASTIRTFSQRHGTPDCTNNLLHLNVRTSEIALQIASTFLTDIYMLALDRYPSSADAKLLGPAKV